jgi:hypothetical protein
MDRARLREVVDRELKHGKSPMTETLPYVVCSFMWNDRDVLSDPSSRTRQKLKARNMVAKLLKFGIQSEFIRGARNAGAAFEIDGRTYAIAPLLDDPNTATVVFEKLLQLDSDGRINEKLRGFASRLDLVVHADQAAPDNRDFGAADTRVSEVAE